MPLNLFGVLLEEIHLSSIFLVHTQILEPSTHLGQLS